jgi:hypothetical protein
LAWPGIRPWGAAAATAGLREQFDQDDRRHNRLTRKVSLKIKIVGARQATAGRALAVPHVDDVFEQPHRRLMRQALDPGHRGVVYVLRSRSG